MAINQQDWNVVRNTLGATTEPHTLYKKVEREITDESGETKTITSFEAVAEVSSLEARASFARIESDVERLIQEINSLQTAERELRNALEETGGAETQRRG